MAIINNKGSLKGAVGNVNFRTLGGQTVMQSNPEKGQVKQSLPTKKWGADFGMSSRRAAMLRTLLYPMIKGFYDSKMINRLNTNFLEVLKSNKLLEIGMRDLIGGDLSLLNNFEFNINLPFEKVFLPRFTCTQEGAVHIVDLPAFNPKESVVFPEQASECILTMLIAVIDFKSGRFMYLGHQRISIAQSAGTVQANRLEFEHAATANSIIVVTVGLDYYADASFQKISLNSKLLNPTKILAVYAGFSETDVPLNPLVQPEAKNWLPISGWTK